MGQQDTFMYYRFEYSKLGNGFHIFLRILHAMFDCFVAAITVVCCFGHNFNMLKNTLPIHL